MILTLQAVSYKLLLSCWCNEIIFLNNVKTLTYRNESPMPYGNIMYDKRIVRGNTYAQRTLPAVSTFSF